MATNLDLSTELQLNTGALGSQTTAGFQTNQDITTLSDGRYFLAYEDPFNGSGTDHDVYGQFINVDGTLSGSAIQIAFQSQFQGDPAVASRAAGGAAVVYTDNEQSAGTDIYLRLVNSSGTVSPGFPGLEVAGNTVAPSSNVLHNPDAVTLANGQTFIVWENDFSVTDHDINARVLNAAGTGFTTATVFGVDNALSLAENPAVAAAGNTVAIVYDENSSVANGNVPDSANIVLRLYDGNAGTFNTPVIIANHTGALGQADVAALANGTFVVTYDDFSLGGGNVFGVIYDPATGTTGPEFVIDDAAGFQGQARVAATADGFVVTYADFGANPDFLDNDGSGAVMTRRFDLTGNPIGDQFVTESFSTSDGAQFVPAVAVSGSHVELTWEDSGSRPTDTDGGIRGNNGLLTIDTINGSSGDDTITSPSVDLFGHVAGTGAVGLINTYNVGEVINAGDGNDLVHGGGGADAIGGGNGDDVIFGDAGDDNLGGNAGNDVIHGGIGNDTIGGDDGNNSLFGDDGNDVMFGGSGNDAMSGGTGDDIMVGLDGADLMSGDDGNDNMNGGAGADILIGGLGNDTVGGGADNDVVVGNEGNDFLFGEDGADQMAGGDGDDVMVGGNGDDVMGGGIGNDTMVGDDGNDGIFGEDGNDNINAGAGNDVVLGGNGDDQIGGGSGNDNLRGDAGNDVLFGESGDDFLTGGTGNDIMVGGTGNDQFVFVPGDGNDTITDFTAGGPDDLIILQGTSLHTLADVQANTAIVGGAAVITYNGTNTITLNGVTAVSQLTINDFAFI